MGGDGHHHGPPYKVPDYKIYKVSDVPELVKVQEMLAVKGLKDPWLRNEVWRFDPSFGTSKTRFHKTFLRGFKIGFGLFVATALIDTALNYGKSGHGHGHH